MRACFITVDGLRTRYLCAGSGPALLLVHPVGYPADIFARNLESLASSHFVIAPDLPGQGFSEPPPCWHVAPQCFMAEHLAAVMRHLDLARYSVVGSSLGGLVAALLALRHPKSVDRLVIVGSGSVFNDPAGQPAVLQQVMANGSTAYVEPSLESCRRRIANTCFAPPQADDILTAHLTAYAWPGALEHYRSIIAAVSETALDPEASAYGHLEAIEAPTLVIVGREDKRTSYESHLAGTLRIPGARIATLEQCGHLPFLEQPEAFNSLLVRFLAGEEPGERPVR